MTKRKQPYKPDAFFFFRKTPVLLLIRLFNNGLREKNMSYAISQTKMTPCYGTKLFTTMEDMELLVKEKKGREIFPKLTSKGKAIALKMKNIIDELGDV